MALENAGRATQMGTRADTATVADKRPVGASCIPRLAGHLRDLRGGRKGGQSSGPASRAVCWSSGPADCGAGAFSSSHSPSETTSTSSPRTRTAESSSMA